MRTLFRGQSLTGQAEALDRAADMAAEEGDRTHETALREAALFKRRCAREEAAGFYGLPVMAFDKV